MGLKTHHRIFSFQGAAKAAGLSKRQIRRYVDDGEIKTFEWGARVFILRSELLAFLNRRKRAA